MLRQINKFLVLFAGCLLRYPFISEAQLTLPGIPGIPGLPNPLGILGGGLNLDQLNPILKTATDTFPIINTLASAIQTCNSTTPIPPISTSPSLTPPQCNQVVCVLQNVNAVGSNLNLNIPGIDAIRSQLVRTQSRLSTKLNTMFQNCATVTGNDPCNFLGNLQTCLTEKASAVKLGLNNLMSSLNSGTLPTLTNIGSAIPGLGNVQMFDALKNAAKAAGNFSTLMNTFQTASAVGDPLGSSPIGKIMAFLTSLNSLPSLGATSLSG